VSARLESLRTRIDAALAPGRLEIIDESHQHVGHAGARDGRGHFRVRLWSERFAGLRPLACHRLVYDAVGELMNTDIHALAIEVLPPEESP
jgi:BolA family transcriptional regulator, general stress-responsive regulator